MLRLTSQCAAGLSVPAGGDKNAMPGDLIGNRGVPGDGLLDPVDLIAGSDEIEFEYAL